MLAVMEGTLAPPESEAPAADFPGLGEILRAGTRVTRANAGLLFGLWAACGLPREILRFAAVAATGVGDNDALQKAFDAGDWSVMGPFSAVGVLGMALGLLGYAATISVAARAHQGRASEVGEALRAGAGRAIAVFLTSVLTAAAAMLGGLLLVLPGLYVLVRLSPALCACVVEGAGARAAVSRSWKLTSGRFWTVGGFISAFVAIAFFAALALFIGGEILDWAASPGGAAGDLLVRCAMSAGQFLISAWVTACLVELYFELAAFAPRPAAEIPTE